MVLGKRLVFRVALSNGSLMLHIRRPTDDCGLDQAEGTAHDIGRWSCHHQRTVRLLRIERARSSVSVVASATPNGQFDSRGLLTDKDGQILLYASSDRSRTHRVVRLGPDANTFTLSRRRIFLTRSRARRWSISVDTPSLSLHRVTHRTR